MRWYQKPMSLLGQAILLIGVGGASWTFEVVDGRKWVIEGSSIPWRFIDWLMIGVGVLRLSEWALGRLPSGGSPLPTGTAHEDLVQAPRPKGAPARVACRKCRELVEASTLEKGQCEACWGVRDAGYR